MFDVGKSPEQVRVGIRRNGLLLEQHLMETDGQRLQRSRILEHELDRALADAGKLDIEIIVKCNDATGDHRLVTELEVVERFLPGVAAVEVDTALTMEKNAKESVLHLRVGRARTATPVRVGDHLLVEIDKQSRLAGIWLLEVPPFPNVEVTA